MTEQPTPRTIDLSVEVDGTPEQVWTAIATGPGISSWFVPTTVEEREGGRTTSIFGPGPDMTVPGRVVAWEPPHRVLFDESRDLVADCAKTLNEGLGLCIAGDRHREISVACKPRLGPNRHSQTADQSEVDAQSCQVRRNPVQR